MKKHPLTVAAASLTVLLAACQPTEGEQVLDWTNLPGDLPAGFYPVDIRRAGLKDDLAAANRLPSAAKVTCGPFQIDVRANPDITGSATNILEATDGNELMNGFFIVISAPEGFQDRVRFREYTYPDVNSRTYLRDGNEWRDITNPERTYEPPSTGVTFRDVYLGFELDRHANPFIDGKFITYEFWDSFISNSVYKNTPGEAPPQGRYRISFLTPYQLEWPSGSCAFRLPDLEFTYRER